MTAFERQFENRAAAFTAITRVQIPSGTPIRISSLHRSSPDIRRCKKPHFCVFFAPPHWVHHAVPTMCSSSADIVVGKEQGEHSSLCGMFGWGNCLCH
jgi:hypothetical protein